MAYGDPAGVDKILVERSGYEVNGKHGLQVLHLNRKAQRLM